MSLTLPVIQPAPDQAGQPDSSGDSPSLLEELMRLVEGSGPLNLSFEDLSGVTADVPDMRLPADLHIHSCDFCLFAKAERSSHLGCIRNKMSVNRLTSRRRAGFTGQCHLGLTDIVQPLLYHGQVLGVFYFGSVVVRGTEERARERILRYCIRNNFDVRPYLNQLEGVPRIEPEEVEQYAGRLQLVCAFAGRLLDAHTPLLNRYRTHAAANFVHVRQMPPLVQRALRHIHLHARKPLKVQDVALAIKCHPDYLARSFQQALQCSPGEYILRVRVDHARRLLHASRYSLDEIAYRSGFHDQSHFNRVFKKLLGVTPGVYRSQGGPALGAHEDPMSRNLSFIHSMH